jgi:hypothetical protein
MSASPSVPSCPPVDSDTVILAHPPCTQASSLVTAQEATDNHAVAADDDAMMDDEHHLAGSREVESDISPAAVPQVDSTPTAAEDANISTCTTVTHDVLNSSTTPAEG